MLTFVLKLVGNTSKNKVNVLVVVSSKEDNNEDNDNLY